MKTLLLKICLGVMVFIFSHVLYGQQVIVTDDATYTTPASGSMLDVKSTTKGFIVPRMTTAQRTTLGENTPVNGVVVYDTEVKCFYYWENSAWNQIAASGLNMTNIKFGDVSNYSTFEADGTLLMIGNATVWDDLQVPGLSTKSSTSAPGFGVLVNGTMVLTFADAAQNSENQVYFNIQMPHSWSGTAIYPHVHYTPQTDPGGTAVVRWGLEYSWAEYNSTTPVVFPASTIIYTDAAIPASSAKKHLIGSFSSITPSSSQDGISSILVCRLFRNSSDAADTYNSKEIGFLSFDIHFESNTIGSRAEFLK